MAEASGWFIDDIELPFAPQSDNRTISRTFQTESIFQFFPSITKSSSKASDYSFKGIIYPKSKIFALDQISASADTNTVIVTVPLTETLFPATKFAVKELQLIRDGPMFIVDDFGDGPETVQVVKFEMVLTQLPDEGEFSEGADGYDESESGGLGFELLEGLTNKLVPGSTVSEFGPFELFKNPELGWVIGLSPVDVAI